MPAAPPGTKGWVRHRGALVPVEVVSVRSRKMSVRGLRNGGKLWNVDPEHFLSKPEADYRREEGSLRRKRG